MTTTLSISNYFIPFLIALGVSIACTVLIRKVSVRKGIMDNPSDDTGRKIHAQPTPLLGGLALFISFSAVLWGYALFTDRVFGGYMLPKYLIGITVGGALLMVGGYLDDRFHLSAKRQITWPILGTLVIIASGIGVSYIQNPFGDSIDLTRWVVTLFSFDGLPYRIILLADAFAFVWLMGMMYTTKFLDGLDGLVSGITTIGAFVLFFLSLSREVAQPETALLAIILAGVTLGFLIFNFHPARIFLGEGGSLWTGFLLGTIAIISGAKIATALLIFGIPILDVAWVIFRRVMSGRSVTQADRQHLHFRLLDVGFSHKQAVIFLWIVTAGFGTAALFLQGKEKVASLVVLAACMVVLAAGLVFVYKKKKGTSS
ncbi:MAG: hypothetical protein A2898_00275 [Candidatus Kerfeldbacteria bacterium RIFCSPLOWO2_01_FULL_48_11]|uniref:Undecaprenyl-phosphate alpha-N-acetylglucosaminyl 1-phosphate transferase n=1 Tax=Candidatus Kerfeldbacteria bacterium RIFCSPLOWO2_01_FULL_48_11 TaxID=1798543 RepID=A0A1G2B805_9BACT|nr:MAG: hypothetical protein A2898_00275 [Candidatus Kerfeldbacteria bacterium RIFCSPLOWO2_01_FULL_48_11]HCJ52210.1 hypothetical protein [Candidatus Kerfeldbacteria bacterium]HCM68468.1 hypothetical protein [Candidatus Kerfeldbacteria bacterium]